jgi:Ice-binding-like
MLRCSRKAISWSGVAAGVCPALLKGVTLKLDTWIKRAVFGGLGAAAVLVAGAYSAGAATAPSLGSAQSFAVLGGTMVTNTGSTTIGGDLGVSPGSAITGQASITLTGATHTADAVALQAQNDVTTAYNALASAPCTQSFTGTAMQVGGQTLTPGVYCYSSSAQLTGTLTLNGGGVFIFKTASTLTTAAGANVALIGGALPCNVFWQVGSSATLFTNTTFVGNILALTSITLQNGAKVSGRVLARNGAVAMNTNTISNSSCAAATTSTTSPTASASGGTAAPSAPIPTAASTQVPRTGVIAGPNTGDGSAAIGAGGSTFVLLALTLVAGIGLFGGGIIIAQKRR